MNIFYTDGSAHPNPGPGGYGVVGVESEGEKIIFTRSKQYPGPVTNNEMELKAILLVMLKFGHNIFDEWGVVPTVYSDSAYCVNIFNDWMFKWAANNWTKSDGKTPENLELIQAYYNHYMNGYRINLKKVKGHAGDKWNEMADQLATGRLKVNE